MPSMRCQSALLVVALVMLAFIFTASVHAQESEIDCKSFVKNADGSWTVIEKVYIPVQKIRVNEGVTFTSDQLFLGEDMVARLNKACPNVQPQPADSNSGAAAGASAGSGAMSGRIILCASSGIPIRSAIASVANGCA